MPDISDRQVSSASLTSELHVPLPGKELCPHAEFYGDAYDHFGLFGADAPTVMAHCVYSTEEEIQRMKENGVYVAHCPESNENLSSGIAPVKRYLTGGFKSAVI